MMRILNMIVFPLTLLSGLLLSAAGLAPFVHPKYFDWLQFLGLTFPALFLLNFGWLIYWWVQLKMKLILPLCFLVLNLIHVSKYVQFTKQKNIRGGTFKVATYNCQLFGALGDTSDFAKALTEIGKQTSDILCLQEFYSKNKVMDKVKALKNAGNFKKYTFYRLTPDRPYGMAIYSNFPMVFTGKVHIGDSTGNMVIFADLLIGKDTVRVYNVHLQSFRFVKKDYAFIEQGENQEFFDLAGSKSIVYRMKDAYNKRATQAEQLRKHIDECKYPSIVMGDFNDVPLSYAYNVVSKGLLDAFRESGRGFERTYKGPFPNFRIDYILFDKDFKCEAYKSISEVPGDHKMVTASLRFP